MFRKMLVLLIVAAISLTTACSQRNEKKPENSGTVEQISSDTESYDKGENSETFSEKMAFGRFMLADNFYASNNDYNVFIRTENGKIEFKALTDSNDFTITDDVCSYSINNDWINVVFKYEILDSIHSAPECELRLKEITNELPPVSSKYSTDSYSTNSCRAVLESILYGPDTPELNNMWYYTISDTGAAYFFESSEKGLEKGRVFNTIVEEAFNHYDGITLHKEVQVTFLGYQEYYDNLKTEVEQKWAREAFQVITDEIDSLSSSCFAYDNSSSGSSRIFFASASSFEWLLRNPYNIVKEKDDYSTNDGKSETSDGNEEEIQNVLVEIKRYQKHSEQGLISSDSEFGIPQITGGVSDNIKEKINARLFGKYDSFLLSKDRLEEYAMELNEGGYGE